MKTTETFFLQFSLKGAAHFMSLGLRQLLLRRAVLGGGLPPEIAADINQLARSSHSPSYLPNFPLPPLAGDMHQSAHGCEHRIFAPRRKNHMPHPPPPLLLCTVVCVLGLGCLCVFLLMPTSMSSPCCCYRVVVDYLAMRFTDRWIYSRASREVTLAGLEPAIFGSEDQHLIH